MVSMMLSLGSNVKQPVNAIESPGVPSVMGKNEISPANPIEDRRAVSGTRVYY